MPGLDAATEYLERRFGVPESVWERYSLHRRSGDVWIAGPDVDTEADSVATGIRLLRDTGLGHSPFKPTTYGLQVLADELSESIVDLTQDELRTVVFERERIDCAADRGYVALRFRDRIIGCGMVTREGLETQIPKGRATDLRHMLDDG